MVNVVMREIDIQRVTIRPLENKLQEQFATLFYQQKLSVLPL